MITNKNRNSAFGTFAILTLFSLAFVRCSHYTEDNYKDNSPTSGKLKIYFDEGLSKHVRNQALTFEGLYPRTSLELFACSESEAIQALYEDSGEIIVISRNLGESELKAFASKKYDPRFSAVAKSGVAVIANSETPIKVLKIESIKEFLLRNKPFKDSLGNEISMTVLFDRTNSSVLHYMQDSLLQGEKLGGQCKILASSLDCIGYVAQHKNSLAFIDFAWLSDKDDSLFKANRHVIKFVALGEKGRYEFPSQSSFKLGTYPFTRTIFVIRKTGDFTLAKGFESFVAGPKGQLTFLKQGLLPTRQSERLIQVNMGSRDQ